MFHLLNSILYANIIFFYEKSMAENYVNIYFSKLIIFNYFYSLKKKTEQCYLDAYLITGPLNCSATN